MDYTDMYLEESQKWDEKEKPTTSDKSSNKGLSSTAGTQTTHIPFPNTAL